MLSVLIVDEQFAARLGLKQLLTEEFRVRQFGEAATANEALEQLHNRYWDLVILNIGTPGRAEFELLTEIHDNQPRLKIMLFGDSGAVGHVPKLRRLGGSGFVAKNATRVELVQAFRTVLLGRKHFPRVDVNTASAASSDIRKTLSKQEHAVLLALAAGKRPGEIAASLNVNAKTVSTYRRRLLDKLGLRSTADLVRYVIESDSNHRSA